MRRPSSFALRAVPIDPCAANTTRLVCRFRHFTGFIAGCQAIGRAGINRDMVLDRPTRRVSTPDTSNAA